MTKKKNRRIQRIRLRKAVNNTYEPITNMGMGRPHTSGYGCGLRDKNDLTQTSIANAMDNANNRNPVIIK